MADALTRDITNLADLIERLRLAITQAEAWNDTGSRSDSVSD